MIVIIASLEFSILRIADSVQSKAHLPCALFKFNASDVLETNTINDVKNNAKIFMSIPMLDSHPKRIAQTG